MTSGTFDLHYQTVFSAAHQLRFEDGSLEPVHGHNWEVEVTMSGQTLDPGGCLIDFHEVEEVVKALTGQLSNRLLNDLPEFQETSPSAEQVAIWLFKGLAGRLERPGIKVTGIKIGEAPGCSVTYRPGETDTQILPLSPETAGSRLEGKA